MSTARHLIFDSSKSIPLLVFSSLLIQWLFASLRYKSMPMTYRKVVFSLSLSRSLSIHLPTHSICPPPPPISIPVVRKAVTTLERPHTNSTTIDDPSTRRRQRSGRIQSCATHQPRHSIARFPGAPSTTLSRSSFNRTGKIITRERVNLSIAYLFTTNNFHF